MLEFFRGCRRKAGCVTLVMALMVFVAWMRSLGIADSLRLGKLGFTSQRGLITWEWLDRADAIDLRSTTLPNGEDYGDAGFFPYENELLYWPIVLCLSLLSAYLILWKPRKRRSSDQPTNSNVNLN